MAGVTNVGFVAKTYQEIFNEIAEYLQQNLGIDINSDPDSVAKIVTNILSLSDSQNWSAVEALPAMFDIDQATGVWLENLCKLKLITRKAGTYSTTFLDVRSTRVFTVPQNNTFYSTDGETFVNNTATLVSTDNTKLVNLTLPTVSIGQTVGFSLDNLPYTVEITADNVSSQLWLSQLLEIPVALGYTYTATSTTMVLAKGGEHFKISGLSGFSVVDFTTGVNIRYTKIGNYTFLPNTITKGLNYSGVISVTNPLAVTGGTAKQTDDQLRAQYKESYNADRVTARGIKSAVSKVSGVTSVTVVENGSDTYDPIKNLPAHSVMVVVVGGEDNAVGQAIYDAIAASVQTEGNTVALVLDSSDNTEAVKFQRITQKYIHVRYSYSLYSEEVFGDTGEVVIREAIVNYINNLGAGKDVIQGRVMGEVYSKVSGVGYSKVELATTTNINDTPTQWYDTLPIPVEFSQSAYTIADKITILEV